MWAPELCLAKISLALMTCLRIDFEKTGQFITIRTVWKQVKNQF